MIQCRRGSRTADCTPSTRIPRWPLTPSRRAALWGWEWREIALSSPLALTTRPSPSSCSRQPGPSTRDGPILAHTSARHAVCGPPADTPSSGVPLITTGRPASVFIQIYELLTLFTWAGDIFWSGHRQLHPRALHDLWLYRTVQLEISQTMAYFGLVTISYKRGPVLRGFFFFSYSPSVTSRSRVWSEVTRASVCDLCDHCKTG